MSRNISHYEILDKLGAGGMGEVYLTGLNNLDHCLDWGFQLGWVSRGL
jgi:hypothetical protein